MTGPAYPPLTAPGGKMVDTMPFKALRICVMTISDTRTDETDTSGHLLADRVREAGHEVAEFSFAGDGTELPAWRQLAQNLALSRVSFLGRLDHEELAPHYRSSYMAIFPAHGAIETFGRTWMEAFAAGRPVISTATDNLKYLVSNGSNGIVIAPTVEGVCQGIRRALSLAAVDYEAMSQRARETAEPYRQSAVVQRLLSFLE
jgi:glycosyltransferase involved in cell wall biosynthesis